MVIGIRPTNDFAFKKIFGTSANKLALISLLNAILEPRIPLMDVEIQNPFNLQEFEQDKLCILDIKATDENKVIYDIEIQISVRPGLMQRLVFYACEEYAGQLCSGEPYTQLKPVVVIALLEEPLWREAKQYRHRFVLTDRESGRELSETLSIHILELTKYNLEKDGLTTATPLECWLYWLKNAQGFEPIQLLELFPEKPFQIASLQLIEISRKTEDRAMHNSREKAIRDYQWTIHVARDEGIQEGIKQGIKEGIREGIKEGEIKGEAKGELKGAIKTIQILENLLGLSLSSESELAGKSLQQLQAITSDLQSKIHNRTHGQ